MEKFKLKVKDKISSNYLNQLFCVNKKSQNKAYEPNKHIERNLVTNFYFSGN